MAHVNELKTALNEEARNVCPPPELKSKVMSQFTQKRNRGMKRYVAAFLIALIIIPTSAFAYQSLLADGLYDSFANVKKHVASATLEGYMTFDAKLSEAKGEMDKEEYEKFRGSLSVLTDAKLKYGDPFGNINYDLMPKEEKEKIRVNSFVLQPYFDKLNGDVPSKELLSSYEYKLFIDALMTYETILAKAEIDTSKGPVEIEKLPVEYQEQFKLTQEFIHSVYQLQEEQRQ